MRTPPCLAGRWHAPLESPLGHPLRCSQPLSQGRAARAGCPLPLAGGGQAAFHPILILTRERELLTVLLLWPCMDWRGLGAPAHLSAGGRPSRRAPPRPVLFVGLAPGGALHSATLFPPIHRTNYLSLDYYRAYLIMCPRTAGARPSCLPHAGAAKDGRIELMMIQPSTTTSHDDVA